MENPKLETFKIVVWYDNRTNLRTTEVQGERIEKLNGLKGFFIHRNHEGSLRAWVISTLRYGCRVCLGMEREDAIARAEELLSRSGITQEALDNWEEHEIALSYFSIPIPLNT